MALICNREPHHLSSHSQKISLIPSTMRSNFVLLIFSSARSRCHRETSTSFWSCGHFHSGTTTHLGPFQTMMSCIAGLTLSSWEMRHGNAWFVRFHLICLPTPPAGSVRNTRYGTEIPTQSSAICWPTLTLRRSSTQQPTFMLTPMENAVGVTSCQEIMPGGIRCVILHRLLQVCSV